MDDNIKKLAKDLMECYEVAYKVYKIEVSNIDKTGPEIKILQPTDLGDCSWKRSKTVSFRIEDEVGGSGISLIQYSEDDALEQILSDISSNSINSTSELSKFYNENKNWTKGQIKEISEIIGLKENKIYKWLWDQKNKEYKATKFVVNK